MDDRTDAQLDSSLIPQSSSFSSPRFRPYPEYRDSGAEWLGEIPAHWEATRLKFLTIEPLKYGANEAAELNDPDLPRYIRITDIREDGSLRAETFKSLAEETAAPYFLKQGDLLFARSGATVGKTFRYEASWGRAAYAGYLIRARLDEKNLDSRFMTYFTQSTWYWDWLRSSFIQATIQNVSAARYANLLVPIPLTSEQHIIDEFLDRETGKIDALVAKKERLIEVLQEKRTALITHDVTKGLDPDVPMKDSGIAWLGEIPAHWEMCHLRRVIEKFVDYRGKTPEKVLSGIPLITGKNIKNQIIDFSLSEEFISEDLYARWMVRGLPEVGDVLVTTEAPLGESAQIQESNIALAQRIILLKANKAKVTNDYLKYHFASNLGKSELLSKATGSTALGIKASHFKATLMTIPPINEQKRIAHHVDGEIEKIDVLIAKIDEGIDRLKEFRTALISAAVTGKIDVREEVA